MRRPVRSERGAAVVDIVLVLVVLVPLVLGILQVALVLFVRNTMASAAAEGARLAATSDRGPADGAALTREQIGGVVSGRFARDVEVRQVMVDGAPGVRGGRPRRASPRSASAARPSTSRSVGHAVEERP